MTAIGARHFGDWSKVGAPARVRFTRPPLADDSVLNLPASIAIARDALARARETFATLNGWRRDSFRPAVQLAAATVGDREAEAERLADLEAQQPQLSVREELIRAIQGAVRKRDLMTPWYPPQPRVLLNFEKDSDA